MTATVRRDRPSAVGAGTDGASAGAIWLALAAVYLVWGSTYLAIRILVQAGMPPLLSAGVRFVVAGALLATVLRIRGGRGALRVDRRGLAAATLVGTLLLVGGNGLVTLAERSVPSGLTALLIAAVPLWVVLLRTVSRDRPRRATYAGVVVGFAGLAVLVLPGGGSGEAGLGGVLTVLGAALSWAVGSWASGRVPLPRDPFVATTWEMLGGGLVMLVAGVGRGETRGLDLAAAERSGWLALAYLIVFGSIVAFTAYVWLLRNAPLSLVATYAYVNPVVAVVLGAVVLSEPITASILLGGAIVVVGVGVVVSAERPRRTAQPRPASGR